MIRLMIFGWQHWERLETASDINARTKNPPKTDDGDCPCRLVTSAYSGEGSFIHVVYTPITMTDWFHGDAAAALQDDTRRVFTIIAGFRFKHSSSNSHSFCTIIKTQ
jgi:hypothetical protein